MKTTFRTYLLLLFVAIFMASCGVSNSDGKKSHRHSATITFMDTIPSDKDFIFSTMGGKMFVMVGYREAQQMNQLLLKAQGITLQDLGVGNAFIVDSAGKMLLYTATHCTKGLENLTRKIDADVVVINYDSITKSVKNKIPPADGYKLGESIHDGDSIFVRGYLTNKEGIVQSVLIKGVGEVRDRDDFKNTTIVNGEHMQQKTFALLLDEDIDLGGLSGAPAFNSQGKVVGVYSGRNREEFENNISVYTLRISLIN